MSTLKATFPHRNGFPAILSDYFIPAQKGLTLKILENVKDETLPRSKDDAIMGWNPRGTSQRNGAPWSQEKQPDDGLTEILAESLAIAWRDESCVHTQHCIIKR